jgi:RNA polymerase sigma-70 factor (ECF subfamily)
MNCQESNLVVARILLCNSDFFRDPGQKAKIVVTFLLALRYINSVRKFRAFYNKHKDMFFAYLMRSTGDYYLASDIMQESFTRCLERYGKDSQNAGLLYTIGRNLIYDNARKQKRNAQLQSEEENPLDDHEHYLMVREEYRQVLAAMQTLEADERDILALAVSSQMSYREISAITGISETNVKVKVHRARTKLRQIIQAGE